MNFINRLFQRMGAKVKRDKKIGFIGDRLPNEEDDYFDTIIDQMDSGPTKFVETTEKKLDIIVMGKEKKTKA